MADVDKALATQLRNIEAKTGKSLDQLIALVRGSGLTKHGQVVAMLKADLGLGHGDANTIAHMAKKAAQPAGDAPVDPLDGIYTGAKAGLRPIHEALLAKMAKLGPFETAPKQKYVSYRRKKQFAMAGPTTNTRVDLGLNMKDLPGTPRLEQQAAGKMCNYNVKLTDPKQVDAELMQWVKAAYDAAG